MTLAGLNSEDAVLRERQFLVDSEISENLVGFAKAAMERFSALSVNNVFRAKSSSSIKTGNTKAKGLSRHQAGFAIDFNGVKTLKDEELAERNALVAEFGLVLLRINRQIHRTLALTQLHTAIKTYPRQLKRTKAILIRS